ncbi:T9SS type A sorting domain-containing protein [Flavobacterium sp. Sd200]|uniref:T9SS type A sorting domain-containing protein n=1 Tax=Flavobacterium sp. Sd200 TaxID=2692211 RepID=UPI00136A31E4|nr:T9SS type A sorting domain-containing protein [Flavobacterium sp. Sd200]MXN92179.1 T9SS type A sorting domain-containing protein [Flavobacterium sp. Sd200]
MKIKLLVLCLFLSTTYSYAQKEFWGTKTGYRSFSPNYPSDFGAIIKTNFDGTNPVVMHAFDSINGSYPQGRLLYTANDKMYGIAYSGGHNIPNSSRADGDGALYEYDLITNRYRVLTFFGIDNLNNVAWPIGGVIADASGNLYGNTRSATYKHNINSGSTSFVSRPPNFTSQLLTIQNEMKGNLTLASDGFLYGTTAYYSACPHGAPYLGSIIRINPATNAFSYIYPFDCTNGPGKFAGGNLIEAVPGKLYGTTYFGGAHIGPEGVAPAGSGILFEYDIATNVMTKKFDFNYATTGTGPGPLVAGDNNKLYGLLEGHGTNPDDPSQEIMGSLYEYDITTNTVTVLHYFEDTHFAGDIGALPIGTLTRGSDGNFYGLTQVAIFKFDPRTNTVTRLAGTEVDNDLLEVCRKPVYRHYEPQTHTLCSGTPFAFDVHNDNATTYVWKKGTTVVASQTTGILHFDSITLADSGVYTCEMTNECGTTITPAITLTVNQSTSSTITSSIPSTADVIMLCPDTSVVLSGNNNGTWSTGETSPTIVVTEAGDYQITNTNSCGNTYSNIVTVQMYELPSLILKDNEIEGLPPGIFTSGLCLGAPITFYGNYDGGVWQDGSTGTTFTTNIAFNTDYYFTVEHPCGTYTSNVIRFTEADMWEANIVPAITVFGEPSICAGGGGAVAISTNRPQNSRNYWTLYKDGAFYLTLDNFNSSFIYLDEVGTYTLERSSFCFNFLMSDPIVVTQAEGVPDMPVVTANNTGTLCEGDSVTLTSSAEMGNVWSNGETTQSITVSQTGVYNVTVTNGCGSAMSAYTNINFFQAPDTTVSVEDNATRLVSNEAIAAAYQWLECTDAAIPPVPVEGAIWREFIPTHDGLYAVRVTSPFGCVATSECYGTGTMSTDGLTKNNIVLYPNPVKDKVTLQTAAVVQSIMVVNMLGQTVVSAKNTKEVDTSQLSAGQYILIAKTDGGIWRGKFIKN